MGEENGGKQWWERFRRANSEPRWLDPLLYHVESSFLFYSFHCTALTACFPTLSKPSTLSCGGFYTSGLIKRSTLFRCYIVRLPTSNPLMFGYTYSPFAFKCRGMRLKCIERGRAGKNVNHFLFHRGKRVPCW